MEKNLSATEEALRFVNFAFHYSVCIIQVQMFKSTTLDISDMNAK